MNGKNIENNSHEAVVSLIKESGCVVKLNVVSVPSDDVIDQPVSKTCDVSDIMR